MYLAGAGSIRADSVHMETSTAVAVQGQTVVLDQSGTASVVATDVKADGSRALLVVADTIALRDSGTAILIARNVQGPVETILDTRGAAVAGLLAGLAIGLVLLSGSLLRGRHR